MHNQDSTDDTKEEFCTACLAVPAAAMLSSSSTAGALTLTNTNYSWYMYIAIGVLMIISVGSTIWLLWRIIRQYYK